MLRKGEEPVPGYRLVRFLGRGQYGEVWQAHGPGGTRVALKFINVSGAQGQKELRGVQRVKEIRHPHLMPIAALWLLDEDGTPLDDSYFQSVDADDQRKALNATLTIEAQHPTLLVVAMGYCDKNLSDRLAEVNEGIPQNQWQGIPVAELLVHMVESAKAIDFLNAPRHDLGDGLVSIQHCDIKPANIMLVGGSVQVCDFGLARMMSDNLKATATGMVGSPAFMAPECIRKRPSTASDQYSLAITYYELRTGRLPFHDLSYMAVFDAHQAGALDFSALGEREQAVLRKATSLEPADRYDSCLVMVGALEEVLSEELPDLRSSPAVGKVRTQQSAARAAAIDTARATGTARERERRSRRGTRVGTKLGLGLALLALAGIAVVVAVPGIRDTVFGLIQPDKDEQGEPIVVEDGNGSTASETGNTTAQQFDFAAAMTNAEQKLQEDDLVEAARLFDELEHRLLDTKTEDTAGLVDIARLGSVRVQSRQPNVDWKALLERAQRLKLANSAGDRNASRALALELLAKTAIGEVPLNERIALFVRVKTVADQLDRWERKRFEDLEVQMLVEVEPVIGSLDRQTRASLEEVGVDTFSLLHARATQQMQQGDFKSSLETVEIAAIDASEEQRQRVDESRLLISLADATSDGEKALDSFSRVAATLKYPSRVLEALLNRVVQEPELIDSAAERVGRIREQATGDPRSEFDRAYGALLAHRIGKHLLDSSVSTSDLLRDCETVRGIDDSNPVVNVCWVEGKVLTWNKDQPIDGRTWEDFNTLVAAALGSENLDATHAAYFHFVAGLLKYHGPGQNSDAAAKEILAAKQDSTVLGTPDRRKQAAGILLAAAQKKILPTDADLKKRPEPNADFAVALDYLTAADGMDSSVAWKANYVIAAGYTPNLDETARSRMLELIGELIKDRTVLDKDLKVLGQVLLLGAEQYRLRFEKQNEISDLDKSLQFYGAFVGEFCDQKQSVLNDLTLYTLVVGPAYEFVKEHTAERSRLSEPSKKALAKLYGARGRLIQRAPEVEHAVLASLPPDADGKETTAAEIAYEAFKLAAELDPQQASYVIGQGQAIIELPNRIELLSELQTLADSAKKLDDDNPGGFALEGYAKLIQSRQVSDDATTVKFLDDSLKAYKLAIDKGKSNDDEDLALYYEGQGTAYVEAAFYSGDDDSTRELLLKNAVDAATQATTIGNRADRSNAHIVLGNAYEDQAYYLKENEKYRLAIEAFDQAASEARKASHSEAPSKYAAGRCQLRQIMKDTRLRPTEIQAKLVDAQRDLNAALLVWGRQKPPTKYIDGRIAEARFWLGDALLLDSKMAVDDIERRRSLLRDADEQRSQSVSIARKSAPYHWARYQLAWATIAGEQALAEELPVKKRAFLDTKFARADAVLEEMKSGSPEKCAVQERDEQEALIASIQADLDRTNLLLLNKRVANWKADSEDAEKLALSGLSRAERLEQLKDKSVGTGWRIVAHRFLGLVYWENSQDRARVEASRAEQLAKAETSITKAIDLGKDNHQLTAMSRRDLAVLLDLRVATAPPEIKRQLAQRIVDTLAPLDDTHFVDGLSPAFAKVQELFNGYNGYLKLPARK